MDSPTQSAQKRQATNRKNAIKDAVAAMTDLFDVARARSGVLAEQDLSNGLATKLFLSLPERSRIAELL